MAQNHWLNRKWVHFYEESQLVVDINHCRSSFHAYLLVYHRSRSRSRSFCFVLGLESNVTKDTKMPKFSKKRRAQLASARSKSSCNRWPATNDFAALTIFTNNDTTPSVSNSETEEVVDIPVPVASNDRSTDVEDVIIPVTESASKRNLSYYPDPIEVDNELLDSDPHPLPSTIVSLELIRCLVKSLLCPRCKQKTIFV